MLELVFVIVIMGIIGTVGAKVLSNIYEAYTSSHINNRLQIETELALQQIANRLQYRFKDSVIVRGGLGAAFVGLSSAPAGAYTVVEWVGYDIDGWLGRWDGAANMPAWSGFLDLDAGNANLLVTPGSDTGVMNAIIADARPLGSGTTLANAAIFFTGANTDIQNGYGWDANPLTTQNDVAAHRINAGGAANTFVPDPATADFTGTDVYEQYKLAWTAYGLEVDDVDGDGENELILYYDYQPWEGVVASRNVPWQILADKVATFQVMAVGDVLKVQLCLDNNTNGAVPANQVYAVCKEKVIF